MTPPTSTDTCDVCHETFLAGQWWLYHARLGVYAHSSCAYRDGVKGEDITTHTVMIGQIPEAASCGGACTCEC